MNDHLVLIQIEGMHCHRCERAIQSALGKLPGVREVEVDFLSGQASVLHEPGSVSVKTLLESIEQSGYKPRGVVEKQLDIEASH